VVRLRYPPQADRLKEIVPHLRRLAFIYSTIGDPKGDELSEGNIRTAASRLGFGWQIFRAVIANDYDVIFARVTAEHFDAAYIGADPLTNQNLTHVIQLVLHHKIPAIGEGPGLAKLGLLLGYGQDGSRDIAHGSEYIDKILRGAKPSDFPVEQGTKIDLAINLKTAKALGLAVPPAVLARADEGIE